MFVRRLATERLLPVALLIGFLMQGCSTESGPTDPLESAPLSGEILGLVTADGTPVSGVTVTLSRSDSEVATVVTAGNGEFGFTDLDAGTYMVAISEIAGMNCSRQLVATVVAGEETEISFACVTPAPVGTPGGTVEGRVTVNGVGAVGILVAIRDGTRHLGTKTTANDGTYRFTNVSTGPKTVWISTEEPCPGTQQENARRQLEVTVSEEGVAVADFTCTGQVVTGRVTVNGIAEPGLSVLVCYGSPEFYWDYGCVPRMQGTDSEGRYTYTSLRERSGFTPGEYYIFVEAPSGTSCPERTGVLVPSGIAVTVDFPCVRPSGIGSVTGRVTVNGFGARHVTMGLRDGSRPMATSLTDHNGVYLFTNVPSGIKTVEIGAAHDPYGCPMAGQEVMVVADGPAGADFACSGQVVTGHVTLNGTPVATVTVLVCHGDEFVDGLYCSRVATDSEGLYTYTSFPRTDFLYYPNLPTLWPGGDHMVFVDPPPAGATCQNPLSPVFVLEGTTVTVDIPCAV